MEPAEQLTAYQQIVNKARRAGLIRYDAHGILILAAPDVATPPATVAAATPAGSSAPAIPTSGSALPLPPSGP